MVLPPAIVIHSLGQARLALAPGRAVTLLSAFGAAGFAGALWWRAVIEAAVIEAPVIEVGAAPAVDVLDCADAAGRALEALACGCRHVMLHPCPAWDAVAARAADAGAVLLAARPPALDLAAPGAERRIAAWLGIG